MAQIALLTALGIQGTKLEHDEEAGAAAEHLSEVLASLSMEEKDMLLIALVVRLMWPDAELE